MSGKLGRGIRRAVAGAFAAISLAGLAGCSLLTPSRANVAPETVRTKLTTPTIATKGVLTVGISASDAPQVMTDSSGQLTGYTVDVARAIAKNLGLTATFVTDGTAAEVGGTGQPDIYLGATSADAAGDITVSGDYLEDAPALFTKESTSAAGTVSTDATSATRLAASDLSSATIAVQTGSNASKVLSECGITAQTKPYGSVNECMKAVADGEVDYAACGASSGAYIARAYAGVVLAGTIDAASTYGIAIRATSADLSQAVTQALEQLSADGTLEAIHRAWYGALPMALSDAMVSGITTSAEREKAQEEQKKAAEAAQDQADQATQSDQSDQAQAGADAGSASAAASATGGQATQAQDNADSTVQTE